MERAGLRKVVHLVRGAIANLQEALRFGDGEFG